MVLEDIIEVDFNLTNIKISNFKIGTKGYDLMKLLDNNATIFRVDNFTFTLTMDYEFVTTPAILGDFGVFTFDLGSQSIIMDSSTQFNESSGFLDLDIR